MRIRLAALIAVIAIAGCKPRNTESILCGQIDGYYNRPISIFAADSVYAFRPWGLPIATVLTDSLGKFSFKLNSKSYQFVYLLTNDNFSLVETPIMIRFKDSVFVKTSIYNTSNPDFGGSNAQFNTFALKLRQDLNIELRSNRFFEWPINEVHTYFSTIESKYKKTIDSMATNSSTPKVGRKLLNAELMLTTATKRFDYLRNHKKETEGNFKYLIPSHDYYQFKKNLLKETDQFWFLPVYSSAVAAMVDDDYQHRPEVIADELKAYDNILESKVEIISTNYVGISQEIAVAQQAKKFTEYLVIPDFFNQLEKANELLYRIRKNRTVSTYYNYQLEKVLLIKPGTLAPEISLPDKNGNIVSLSQFKGKVVLIVFWGTWCPPCLSSIPKYLEMQEQLKGKDMEFVFVSLEARVDDIERWREFIEGRGTLAKRFLNGKTFPGVHLIAQGQFQNQQVQQYAVNYAPSYILIDAEGRIASPRFGLFDEGIELIKEMLEKKCK